MIDFIFEFKPGWPAFESAKSKGVVAFKYPLPLVALSWVFVPASLTKSGLDNVNNSLAGVDVGDNLSLA